MKRESGVNPEHYPMLLAPQRVFCYLIATVREGVREGRKRWSKSEDLPFILLIAAFGIKSTGEMKVGVPAFFCI
jgi:hypothetical protein